MFYFINLLLVIIEIKYIIAHLDLFAYNIYCSLNLFFINIFSSLRTVKHIFIIVQKFSMFD